MGSSPNPGAGWTQILDGANNAIRRIAYRFADGTEGSTMSYSYSGNASWRAIATRYTGAHASTPPALSSRAGGENNAPNPPSLNPAGWDVEDTKWEAIMWGAAHAITSPPSGYTDLQIQTSLGVAFRNNAAASEDPGAFALSESFSWDAHTMAIRPAQAASKIAMML